MNAPMPSNVKNFLMSIDKMLRGGPANFNLFPQRSSKEESARLLEATLSQGPRALPFNKASFYFLLILIGCAIPAIIRVLEPKLQHRRKKGILRVIKDAFVFSFLIRVQHFGYIYFVLVAF